MAYIHLVGPTAYGCVGLMASARAPVGRMATTACNPHSRYRAAARDAEVNVTGHDLERAERDETREVTGGFKQVFLGDLARFAQLDSLVVNAPEKRLALGKRSYENKDSF